MKATNPKNKLASHNPKVTVSTPATMTRIRKMIVAILILLLPGILFSSAQEIRVENVASEFIKADPQSRAALTRALIQKGKDAVPDVLSLLDSNDIEVQVR